MVATETYTCDPTDQVCNIVNMQNQYIRNNITKIKQHANTIERKYEYDEGTLSNLQFLNNVLFVVYYIMFAVIHVFFFEQYLLGVHRNEIVDTLFLTFFAFYPIYINQFVLYIYGLFQNITLYKFRLFPIDQLHFKLNIDEYANP